MRLHYVFSSLIVHCSDYFYLVHTNYASSLNMQHILMIFFISYIWIIQTHWICNVYTHTYMFFSLNWPCRMEKNYGSRWKAIPKKHYPPGEKPRSKTLTNLTFHRGAFIRGLFTCYQNYNYRGEDPVQWTKVTVDKTITILVKPTYVYV